MSDILQPVFFLLFLESAFGLVNSALALGENCKGIFKCKKKVGHSLRCSVQHFVGKKSTRKNSGKRVEHSSQVMYNSCCYFKDKFGESIAIVYILWWRRLDSYR